MKTETFDAERAAHGVTQVERDEAVARADAFGQKAAQLQDRADVAEIKNRIDRAAVKHWCEQLDALRAAHARMTDALHRYGEHDGDCAASVHGAAGDTKCTCGYDEWCL